MRVLAVVPAYNEEESLPHTINDLQTNRPDVDVLVVDDGSRDNTTLVARELGCRVVTLPHNLGIGGAVQTGLMYAVEHGYDVIVQFDADGQHLACEMEKVLAPVFAGEVDVAIGSRFLGSGGFKSTLLRRCGIKLFELVISGAVRRRITDSTSGFRAFNREVFSYLAEDYPCDYPEVEAVVVLAKNGFRIKEVSVKMRERVAGRSSIRPLHSVYYMIKVLLAILMSVLRSPSMRPSTSRDRCNDES